MTAADPDPERGQPTSAPITHALGAGSGDDIDRAGWLSSASRRPSPHEDARPAGTRVDLLVIHSISLPPGEFEADWIDDLFLGRLDLQAHPWFERLAGLRVSPHLLIRRDGTLLQYVPLHRRAWHAGASSFAGKTRCNDFSIGIELEGCDWTPFTDAQYRTLAESTARILRAYPHINRRRIVGHNEISPGRKTDPGPWFDWRRFLGSLGSSEDQRPRVDAEEP
jgi:AmpD protein